MRAEYNIVSKSKGYYMNDLPFIIKVFSVFAVVFMVVQAKGCADCMGEGGSPVQGVFGYVCLKNK